MTEHNVVRVDPSLLHVAWVLSDQETKKCMGFEDTWLCVGRSHLALSLLPATTDTTRNASEEKKVRMKIPVVMG